MNIEYECFTHYFFYFITSIAAAAHLGGIHSRENSFMGEFIHGGIHSRGIIHSIVLDIYTIISNNNRSCLVTRRLKSILFDSLHCFFGVWRGGNGYNKNTFFLKKRFLAGKNEVFHRNEGFSQKNRSHDDFRKIKQFKDQFRKNSSAMK